MSKLKEFIKDNLPTRTFGKIDNHWYRIGLAEGINKGFKKACALILEEAEKKYYLYSKRESKYMKNPEVLIRDDLQQIIKEMTDE